MDQVGQKVTDLGNKDNMAANQSGTSHTSGYSIWWLFWNTCCKHRRMEWN